MWHEVSPQIAQTVSARTKLSRIEKVRPAQVTANILIVAAGAGTLRELHSHIFHQIPKVAFWQHITQVIHELQQTVKGT
jgi:hypothetical protein